MMCFKNRSRIPVLLFITVTLPLVSCLELRSFENENDPETVRVAGIILKWNPNDRDANFVRAKCLIEEAASKGAKIIGTSESFLDGYSIRFCGANAEEFYSMAEPIPDGQYFKKLQKLADELNVYLIAAMTERDDNKIYNSAALIGPDGSHLGTYRKNYLWVDEVGKYTPGDSFPAFSTEYGNIGMMICSDRRNPESIKQLAASNADIVFCPAGGGYGPENDSVVSQRSREGNVPIVFVHPIEFLVTGPSGEILRSDLHGDHLDESIDDSDKGVVRYYDLHLTNDPE